MMLALAIVLSVFMVCITTLVMFSKIKCLRDVINFITTKDSNE